MTTNLRLITHATECHTNKFSIRRTRDRLTERCLAYAGRADETKNRRLNFFDALLHGEVFQNAFLDFIESVVVVFEHFLCMREIIVDLGFFLPRQANKDVNVITNYGRFSRHRRHKLKFFQFGLRLFTRLFGHLGSDDFLVELFKVCTFFALTQLFLNCFDLLVQIVLTLRFFHLALDATTDTLLHLQNVELSFELTQQMLVTLCDVEDFEDDLFLLQQQRQVSGDGIGKTSGIIDASKRSQNFRRDFFVEFDVLVKLLNDGTTHRLDFGFITRL